MYAPGQLWLTPKDVVGRAKGFLPYVGMVTIMMNEYPKLKVNYFYLTQLFQFFINQILFYTVCGACLPRPVCSDSQGKKQPLVLPFCLTTNSFSRCSSALQIVLGVLQVGQVAGVAAIGCDAG